MALFKAKKNTSEKTDLPVQTGKTIKKVSVKEVENKPAKKEKEKVVSIPKIQGSHLFSVLKNARITEKATDLSQDHNVYVFEVDKNTNKREISKAVKTFYNVTPEKIRTVKIPLKNVISRGKRGVKSGGKKAYIYLKKGDKLELI
ncbi:MAG: ribosomal L23 family protein [Parcubacteria group bacterium Athens0714_16]|nr:MAG: ribosomal L23 family protein [Parcubacteria group bacterium Athens0714_16]